MKHTLTAGSIKLPGASFLVTPSTTMTIMMLKALMMPSKLVYDRWRTGRNSMGVRRKKDNTLISLSENPGNNESIPSPSKTTNATLLVISSVINKAVTQILPFKPNASRNMSTRVCVLDVYAIVTYPKRPYHHMFSTRDQYPDIFVAALQCNW